MQATPSKVHSTGGEEEVSRLKEELAEVRAENKALKAEGSEMAKVGQQLMSELLEDEERKPQLQARAPFYPRACAFVPAHMFCEAWG